MKKEIIITAFVFFAVGFLAGYIYDSQRNWSRLESSAAPAGEQAVGEAGPPAAGSAAATGSTAQSLPPGHPSVEVATTMKELEDEAAQNPKDPGPPLKLANLFYDQRMFDRAVTWYQRALELSPNDVNAHTDLGTAYLNLGRPKDALEQYRKSLEIDPTHEPTMYNMIIVNLEGTHDTKAARLAWEKLYRRNPNYPGLAGLKDRL